MLEYLIADASLFGRGGTGGCDPGLEVLVGLTDDLEQVLGPGPDRMASFMPGASEPRMAGSRRSAGRLGVPSAFKQLKDSRVKLEARRHARVRQVVVVHGAQDLSGIPR